MLLDAVGAHCWPSLRNCDAANAFGCAGRAAIGVAAYKATKTQAGRLAGTAEAPHCGDAIVAAP